MSSSGKMDFKNVERFASENSNKLFLNASFPMFRGKIFLAMTSMEIV